MPQPAYQLALPTPLPQLFDYAPTAGHAPATEDIGRLAARRLLAEIREQPEAPLANAGISPELVVRGSTAPPRPKR